MSSSRRTTRHRVNGEADTLGGLGLPGSPTGLSCPRCGGVLGEQPDGGDVRLECRTGHVVLLETLLDAKAAAVEDALWAAVRALEEKSALAWRLSQRAQHRDDLEAADRHARLSRAAGRRAGIVRDVLVAHQGGDDPTGD
jgi:two-component system, chemotaxis family, protein-glutamate methylesterase/glutaminase